MQTRDTSSGKVTIRGGNPETKPKSKPLARLRSAGSAATKERGQARGCARGGAAGPGAGTPRRSSPATVGVKASRGERGREKIRTFWETLLQQIFHRY